MPEFVLNRNHMLASTSGHRIEFLKGKPTYVPPVMVKEAVAIGAMAVDGGTPDVLPPEDVPQEVLSPQDKEAMAHAAFDQIIERNDTADFTGDGKPSTEAVKKIVEFNFTRKELNVWVQTYRDKKAA